MDDHFILTFTRTGEPRLERVRYDPTTGNYSHLPIPRESETAQRAIASPAGRWYRVINDAIEKGEMTPVPGCARCADLFAAHLLAGGLYDKIQEHLTNHEFGRSIWPEVNEIAAGLRVEPTS